MDQSDNSDRAARSWSTIQGRNRDSLQQWCDLATGLQAVRGQWKASILIALSEQARDIPALQRRLDLADRRVLVRALRALEADGLIARSGDHGYVPTPDGDGLVIVLRDLAQWQAARSQAPTSSPAEAAGS